MGFSFNTNRRKSNDSSMSTRSTSSSSTDDTLMSMTLPMAPREDNYNMSEEQRQQRILAKCRKLREPWKSAKPIGSRE